LLGLLYDPEDGSYMFLQNIGSLSADYMALYPGRYKSFSLVFEIFPAIL
jgi:hypothetical protein